MAQYPLCFRLLPLAALLCVGSCLSTDGYYRYQDGGPSGAAGDGTPGTAGSGGGSAGTAGSGGDTAGVAGNTATGTAGRGGTTGTAGRGGTTGTAGRGGTTGTAGRGGTTGAAGSIGGSVLFSDDFETGTDGWDFTLTAAPPAVVMDGSKVLNISETAGDQALGAVGSPSWTNFSVEAKVKVTAFTGTSSSDGVAICARLSGAEVFYYFAIQANDMKGKIKINNSGNSSLSSSFDAGFVMNTWITMRLDVQGNTLTAYVNGIMRSTFTVTDSGQMLTMGGTGFMVQRANALFDDIVVRSIP